MGARIFGSGERISVYEVDDSELAVGSTLGGPKGAIVLKASGAIDKFYSSDLGATLIAGVSIEFWDAPTGAAERSLDALVTHNRRSAKSHSGIWRDLAVRKRRTEVDVQIAPIAEIGKTHGIACPAVEGLVAMIHEIEDGKRALSDANLIELARAASV